MIFDTLPLDIIEKREALRMDINFLAEARYGEVISIGSACEGDKWQFEISSDSGKTICRAMIEFK